MQIQAYDRAEQQALDRAPEWVCSARRPVLFDVRNYPTVVSSETELPSFADAMQDGRAAATLKMLGGMTDEEKAYLGQISKVVAGLTKELGRKVVPKDAPIRALLVVRKIRQEVLHGGTVLEIGPGSGYVGAFLILMGYRYLATDVSQAFYLWQNRLFEALAGEAFWEFAEEREPGAWGQAFHIPWWIWMNQDKLDTYLPQLDGATCNHALAEMYPGALTYTLGALVRHLKREAPFFVEGFGAQQLRKADEVERELELAGFGDPGPGKVKVYRHAA